MNKDELQNSIDYFDSDYVCNIADETRKHLGIIIAAVEEAENDADMQHENCIALIEDAVSKYEATQQQLAEANVNVRQLKEAIWSRGNAPIGNESEHENERDALILDLRAQLAASQAEVAEEQKNGDSLVEQRNAWADVATDLRAELAEAQAERDDIQADNLKALELIIDGHATELELIKQLAASQAEVSRLEDLYNSDRVSYLDDITLLQSEVERFRSQRDELGDSLYKKSPDSAEFYDYTPTWRRDDPR